VMRDKFRRLNHLSFGPLYQDAWRARKEFATTFRLAVEIPRPSIA
jgi:hypothetical protein